MHHDRSRLSVGRGSSKNARAMRTADGDAVGPLPLPFEFFLNIWGASPAASDRAVRRSRKKRVRRDRRSLVAAPLIDISQVAHVVTTMTDFRNDYAPLPMQLTNLWDDPSLERSDTEPDAIMSPIHSADGADTTSGEDDESSFASSMSAVFRPSPAAGELLQRGQPAHAVEVIYPTAADATEASGGAQLTKIKPAADPQVAAPRALKDGGVVFSTAFLEPMDWTWAVKFLLALHEPVRHALFVMDCFLEHCHAQYAQLEQQQQPLAAAAPVPALGRRRHGRSAPSAAATATALALETHVADFFTWFKTCFVEFLRCQHELKTNVLLPLVSLKVDAKREVLDRYREVFQLVEQMQQLERALCVTRGACSRSAWLRRLDVLRREIRTLHTALLAALALEDRVLQPALSNTFTEHTFFRYVMPRVFRSIRAKRVVVPWVVERSKIWGGDREHASMLSLLPFSAKLLYRKIWRPFFVSNVAVAMKKLLDVGDGASASASASASAFGNASAAGAASFSVDGTCANRRASPAAGGSERREEMCGIQ